MKRRVQIALMLMAVGYYVGCAPVRFDKDTDCGANCVNVNGMKTYRYSIIPNSGKVDILFVDDNSASMSTEQRAIASRFSSFISALDMHSVDYRIAITTTDVVKSPGQLISFGDGSNFLTSSVQNRVSLFADAIKRKETVDCEAFLSSNPNAASNSATYQQNCPSPDERGIYAANLVVKSNPGGFIRPEAHLAVVFISDEDERSQLYDEDGAAAFRLASEDLPQTLISNVQSLYSGKSLSAHALIVRPGNLNGMTPQQAAERIATVMDGYGHVNSSDAASSIFSGGDSGCLDVQNHQLNGVSGSFGYVYALAARLTGGVEGNICASDYSSQLTSIGENIGEQIAEHTLHCSDPVAIDASTPMVTFTPTRGSYNIVGNKMTFSPDLTPGTQVYLQYACPE